MAITQNTYTGNGSTVLFSFTFPYLETTDIKVSLNGVNTTAYTLANATTIQFNSAPANGTAIRIYRQTDDSGLTATFSPGSAIRSQDLNDNFTQNLYVTQESNRDAAQAITTADAATVTANTALSNSAAAVSTANTASSNASAAVSTANSASAAASNAVSTANNAEATAIAASATAASAVSTANTASSNASSAVSTANSASSTATTALNLVNSVVSYDPVANVAAIPGSPANGDRIEILDSTGVQSFTPLTGLPSGFNGAANLSVRLVYDGTNTTWEWVDYSPTDPDARYLRLSGGTLTGVLTLNADPVSSLQPATKQYVDTANTAQDSAIASKLPLAGGTLTGALAMGTNKVTGLGDPTSAQDAATKNYVDTADATKLSLSGGTMTGNIVFNAGQTIPGYTPRTSATGAAVLPTGTALQRDGSPAAGYIRFNTDVGQFEGYNGTSWASVGGGATGGGADQWALEHDNTITTSYTISNGKNVISAGPITINSGAVVTVPTGSSWAIV